MIKEINYNAESVMLNGFPQIKKLGAVSPNCEATPFVFHGRMYRLENVIPERGSSAEQPYCAIVRDRENGEILSAVGGDCYFYSLYTENDTVYVIGTKLIDDHYTTGDTLIIFESTDLHTWSRRELLSNPGWRYFNTSLTKGPDGYVLCMEASDPKEYVGVPFTCFFATSPDLQSWTFMDYEKCYPKDRYTGGPWMRYSRGYYYLICMAELPCLRYTNYLVRTKDFDTWEIGYYNPLLMPNAEDKKLSLFAYDFSGEFLENMRSGFISSNSDLDMCDWNGKTLITYNAGNQLGFSYLAEAEYNGSMDDFLEANFR